MKRRMLAYVLTGVVAAVLVMPLVGCAKKSAPPPVNVPGYNPAIPQATPKPGAKAAPGTAPSTTPAPSSSSQSPTSGE